MATIKRISTLFDRLYSWVYQLPACTVSGGCYCRRGCLAMLGKEPQS